MRDSLLGFAKYVVTPAKAGAQITFVSRVSEFRWWIFQFQVDWVPAYAGKTAVLCSLVSWCQTFRV